MASATVYNPQSWNRYAYVLNNPYKYIDPTGMQEMTADACKKDNRCVTVKINVIYDKNANGGKGITDKQKEHFNKNMLQNARDEYGTSKILLDVQWTVGSYKQGKKGESGTLTGISGDAINVLVTDSSVLGKETGVSAMQNGIAVSAINIKTAGNDIVAHELAHHFMGDASAGFTQSSSPNDGFILGLMKNHAADFINGSARTQLREFKGAMPQFYSMDSIPGDKGIFPRIHTPFNSGAHKFNDYLKTQEANRPKQ